jgi:hypothetical protein
MKLVQLFISAVVIVMVAVCLTVFFPRYEIETINHKSGGIVILKTDRWTGGVEFCSTGSRDWKKLGVAKNR